MNIIVSKLFQEVSYATENQVVVVLNEYNEELQETESILIADDRRFAGKDFEVIEITELPSDYKDNKYKYVDNSFVLNENYTYWQEVDGVMKHFDYLGNEIVEKSE